MRCPSQNILLPGFSEGVASCGSFTAAKLLNAIFLSAAVRRRRMSRRVGLGDEGTLGAGGGDGVVVYVRPQTHNSCAASEEWYVRRNHIIL